MKVFTCTDHDCHYPIGVASVVVAESKEEAARYLSIALELNGLDPSTGFTLEELNTSVASATILHDGNY